MDILRRNTDYALRLMVNLARHHGNGALSTRVLADEEAVSYQLACKLMQQLHGAKLVESRMGPKGGFRLRREPGRINILEVIEAIQGPVRLNRCLLSAASCPRRDRCSVRVKIAELQDRMERYLGGITLDELVQERAHVRKGKRSRPVGRTK
jgi:Rrf2 family protein